MDCAKELLRLSLDIENKLAFANSPIELHEQTDSGRMLARLEAGARWDELLSLVDAVKALRPTAATEAIALRTALANGLHHRMQAQIKPARDAFEAAACQPTATHAPPKPEGKNKTAKATVSARMYAAYDQAPHERAGWSAQQWATYLGCGKSTVIGSPVWERLKLIKAGEKLSRAKPADKRKNNRPI